MTRLDDIRPGDEVAIVSTGWNGSRISRVTVDRRTPTQIHAGGRIWYVASGRERGENRGRWDASYKIEPWNGEYEASKIAEAVDFECQRLRELVRRTTPRLTLDQLRRIAAILGEDGT